MTILYGDFYPLLSRETFMKPTVCMLVFVLASLFIISIAFHGSVAQAQGVRSEKWDSITQLMQDEVDAKKIPGAVAAISYQGKPVYFEAVGFQDATAKLPMPKDAIFRIASMTKAITSVSVMQLVEQGKVSLNDPLSQFLPEFAAQTVLTSIDGGDVSTVKAARPVTIHDLLTHRSGLTYGWFGPAKLDDIYKAHDIPDLFIPIEERLAARVDRIAKVPLKFQPGSRWDYSVATDVLGRVVEVVSGQSLDAYFREHILNPLKMHDTHFQLPAAKESRLAKVYTIDGQAQIQPVGSEPIQSGFFKFSGDYHQPGKFFSGGGGLLASTHDYMRFLQMLLNRGELDGVRVLKIETVEAMTKNQVGDMTIPFPSHGDGFGLGFGVHTDRGKADDVASIGTFSWGGIFNSYYWVDPQTEMIGVLMMQVFPNDHLTTRAEFKRLAYEAIGRRTTAVSLTRSATDESASGLECFRVDTGDATYYLEKVGAGLSSMIDRDGNDWLSFHPDKGTGAAGEYRGFPNAVYKEAGNYFHPRNVGTDPCICLVEEESPDRVVISANSSNGLWAGKYTFTAEACTFTMTKKPADKKFWVLYEGTPGGQYDDADWWMTSAITDKSPMTKDHDGDIAAAEWIAFGDKNLDRTLVLHHTEDDDSPDRFYQMEKKMTVFGFGRKGMTKYLESVPQSFSIRFVESTDHATIKEHVAATEPVKSVTSSKRLAVLEQFAMTNAGDVTSGKTLFEAESTQCVTCHQVGETGGHVGPNLSQIGGKFDRPHLIESLLHPAKQIGYGYETSILLTTDGKIYTGVVKETDDKQLTIVDALNRRHTIAKDEIEEQSVSKTSLMPSGLADSLSPQQFTDVVAYLETLRSGKQGFGSGVSGPISLPDGFRIETVATGLSGATAFDIADDGRIFVCEQEGQLRVISDGRLLETPFVTIPVEMNWERGLIGVTLAPNFPRDPHLYVVYVTKEPYTHHRISRYRANGNVAAANSEVVLLKGDDQSKFGGHVPAGHQGGGIHFGTDGKLYIGIGEQTAKTPSQRFDALQGKILRINPDGSIPDDNPFLSKTTGKYQSIWAIGCRNPFTFAVRKPTGEIFINDVGGKFEEINRGVAGANYGWPNVDHGPTDRTDITGPLHIYPEASISGGDFLNQKTDWPEPYRGKYFFADFKHGWIKWIDPEQPAKSHEFLSGIRRPVDIRFGPDGSLYVLLRNAWIVDDKFVGGTSSLVRVSFVANQ